MSVRTLTLAAAAVSALVLVPLPAYAETVTTHDASGDVRSQSASEEGPTEPAPDRVEGDVLTMRVLHGPRNVRVNLHSARLTRTPGLEAVHSVTFLTDEGRSAELAVHVTSGDWQGEDVWTVGDEDRTCRGLHTYVSYRTETVRVVVPRTCLSSPRWVRVGGGSGFLVGEKLYADDVNRDDAFGHEARLGGKVRRGCVSPSSGRGTPSSPHGPRRSRTAGR
jgi:hypothetical protein